ncbi:nitroreductase [Streptomyces sp. LaPpAH-108]|uniref:nitroreductase n=1 Tax=Streptomyces sp. LaPpAH-108 TaxID=1155714 RepID=UPI00036C92EC|nr:nitroreductase [Streptomyces sp. LaPpAH-108]
MDVYEAVDSRRAVRAFSDRPVPRETLERVLTAATRAPSSGNLQPWHVYVVTGEPLAALKRRATARAVAGDPGDPREYPMYPPDLTSPYLDRFTAAATQRYRSLGIDRDDPDRPRKITALNSAAFGAPVVLFCYLDRAMGPGQWADLGMYLQTVMLLLRAEGLHSCPQVMWTMYRETVSRTVGAAPDHALFCGLSLGFAKEDVPPLRTGRAELGETVRFVDNDDGGAESGGPAGDPAGAERAGDRLGRGQ